MTTPPAWRGLTLAAVVALLAGCGGGESNVLPPTELKSIKAERSITVRWRQLVGKRPEYTGRLYSVYHDGRVYVTDGANKLMAYEANKGKLVWSRTIDGKISTSVALAGDSLLLATREGQVGAYDVADGAPRWRVDVEGEVLAPPVEDSGVVVAQTVDGGLTGLSLKDGSVVWRYEHTEPALSLRGTAKPLALQGLVVTGFARGHIVGIDVRNGNVLWNRVVAYPTGRSDIERLIDVDAPPMIQGFQLYAVSYQGKLIAIDLRNGRLLWSRPVSAYRPFVLDSRNLYLINDQGAVFAIDRSSGATVWVQNDLKGRRLAALELASGVLLLGDYQGYVHLLSTTSGDIVGRREIADGQVLSHSVAPDGTVFSRSADGTLAALEISS